MAPLFSSNPHIFVFRYSLFHQKALRWEYLQNKKITVAGVKNREDCNPFSDVSEVAKGDGGSYVEGCCFGTQPGIAQVKRDKPGLQGGGYLLFGKVPFGSYHQGI